MITRGLLSRRSSVALNSWNAGLGHAKCITGAGVSKQRVNPYVTSCEDAAKDCSYVRGLFFGVNNDWQAFPYPNNLDEEAKETINMLVDPVKRFFGRSYMCGWCCVHVFLCR